MASLQLARTMPPLGVQYQTVECYGVNADSVSLSKGQVVQFDFDNLGNLAYNLLSNNFGDSNAISTRFFRITAAKATGQLAVLLDDVIAGGTVKLCLSGVCNALVGNSSTAAAFDFGTALSAVNTTSYLDAQGPGSGVKAFGKLWTIASTADTTAPFDNIATFSTLANCIYAPVLFDGLGLGIG